jgi:hypothetical protein
MIPSDPHCWGVNSSRMPLNLISFSHETCDLPGNLSKHGRATVGLGDDLDWLYWRGARAAESDSLLMN